MDYEADPSFAVSPEFSELHPKLQIPICEMVGGLRNHELELEDDILAFAFALLHHVRREGHRVFLDSKLVAHGSKNNSTREPK